MPKTTASEQSMIAPETRGVGRTPSEEFQASLSEGVGFGYFGNAILNDATKEKIDQTIKDVLAAENAEKGRKKKFSRRTPDRSYSCESYEGYHKKLHKDD
mmetsp:Transcript_17037/g.34293  ORF Transcript_17037/g.34293 Transcript_17037/m.34293 type:complete len:100 (+) Transcript_17037:67-366(+)